MILAGLCAVIAIIFLVTNEEIIYALKSRGIFGKKEKHGDVFG